MVQSKARMPEMNAQRLCMDAKPTKRSFKGKGDSDFRAIVRFWEGWVRNEGLLTEVSEKRKGYGKCGNPSGSRPNFFGDSTSPLTRGGKNVVRSEGEASNPSVLTAKRFGDKKGVDMQLKRNKATVCALPSIHLPLTREARVGAAIYLLSISALQQKKSGTVPYPINLNR